MERGALGFEPIMGWRRQKGLTFSVALKFRLLMLSPNQGYMIAIKRGVKKIFFKKL